MADKDPYKIIGKYKVVIKRSKCIGAASCLAVSPDVYDMDEDNIAVFKDGEDTPENILMSAQVCPTKAIEIFNTETGEQIWPKTEA